jgi:hypothetical protein
MVSRLRHFRQSLHKLHLGVKQILQIIDQKSVQPIHEFTLTAGMPLQD